MPDLVYSTPDRIARHELSIFKLSESISYRPAHGATVRDSDVSEVPGDAHPVALQADLNHYKELFSKLRFSYLEQVTKEKFLRAITEDPPLIVEREENARLEEQLGLAKKDLQASKVDVDKKLAELDALSRQISSDYEVLSANIDETEKLPKEIVKLQEKSAVLEDSRKPSESSLPLDETLVAVAQKENELEEFERQLDRADRTVPEQQRRLDSLNREILPMETDKAGMEKFASEAIRMRDSARAEGKADRETAGQWYQLSYETLSALLSPDDQQR